MRLKEMLENKAKLAAEIRRQADTLNDQKPDFTAEEQSAWDKVNADYNALCRRLDVEKRAADVAGSTGSTVPRTELAGAAGFDIGGLDRDRSLAVAAWFCRDVEGFELTDDHREACRRVGVKLGTNRLDLNLTPTDDYRRLVADMARTRPESYANLRVGAAAMTVGTGANGGSLVPPGELLSSLEIAMLTYGGVRQVAETIRTDDGEPLKWPTANDTSNTGELLGEAADFTGSGDHPSTSPTIGLPALLAYKFSSKPVLVTSELLEDSKFGLPSLLGTMLGVRLGRVGNTYQTTGTGTSQPQGIVTGSVAGKTAALTTTFTSDEIIDLIHSVDPAYRVGAGFMANDLVLAFIRKMKDGESRYLWQSGLTAGMPDTLLGYSLTPNNDMSSAFTTGQKLILFGKLSAMKIRTVGKVRIVRLNELYAATDEVGFNAYTREDSRVVDAGTNPIKHLKLA